MNGRFNTQKILKWLKATSCGWVEQAELKQRSGYDHMHTLRQIRVSVLMQPAFLYGLYAFLQWLLCVLILAFVVIQVELERVRLICERICRRERLKVPTSWILPGLQEFDDVMDVTEKCLYYRKKWVTTFKKLPDSL